MKEIKKNSKIAIKLSHAASYSGRRLRGVSSKLSLCVLSFKNTEIIWESRKDNKVISTQKRGFRRNFVKSHTTEHNVN